eukprot:TRINITY_DN2508_c0_g1_i1.p1 TRINITY_DN2508_c0_g1~~TRINITY_DN2508_c0_g1_i1.p1  ORF type:complete len:1353 (-),score=202.12 TRINITY_DN2508_c0_g1_i1:132-4190(-)
MYTIQELIMTRTIVVRASVFPNIYCVLGLLWACLSLSNVAHGGYAPVTKASARGFSAEALFSWTAPGSANETLLGYDVYQDSVVDGAIDVNSAVPVATLPPSTRQALVTGLQPNRTYELAVFAKYTSGNAEAKIIEYRTQHSMTRPQYHEPAASLVLTNSTTRVSLPRVHGHALDEPICVALWVFVTGSTDMHFVQAGDPMIFRMSVISGYLETKIRAVDGTLKSYTMSELLPLNQWVHISSYVGPKIIVIAMGDYVEFSNISPSIVVPSLSAGTELGNKWNISSAEKPVEGYVSQLKIWNIGQGFSSEKDLEKLCNSILDPIVDPNLLAYYPLDEGQGDEVRNLRGGASGSIQHATWFQFAPSTPPMTAEDSGETCARCVDDIFVSTRGSEGARQLQFMVPTPASNSSGNSTSNKKASPGLTVTPGRLAAGRPTGFYSTIAALGPTVYYPLDDTGSVAHDRSGHNRHLYYYPGSKQHSDCSISNNRIGGCVEIGPTNPTLTYPDLPQSAGFIWGGGWSFGGLVWRSQPLTVGFWMYPTGYPSSNAGHIVGNEGWNIGFDINGQVAMYIRNRGAFWMAVSSSIYPPLNTWTHVAVTWTGDDITVYYNGTWASTENVFSYSVLSAIPMQPSMSPLQIGYCYQCPAAPESFQGRLADVVIFDRQLLPGQVSRLVGLKAVSVDGGISSQQVSNARLPSHPMVSKGSRTVIHGHVDVAGDIIVRGRDFTFTQDPSRREVTLFLNGMGEVPTVIPQPPWRVLTNDPRSTGCPEVVLTYPADIKEIPPLTFMAVGESRHQWPVGHWRNPAPICTEVDPSYASIWGASFKVAYLGSGSCTAVPNVCAGGGNGDNWPLVHRSKQLPPSVFKPTTLTPLAGSQAVVVGGGITGTSKFKLADGSTVTAAANDLYFIHTNIHNDSLSWVTLVTGAFDITIRGLITLSGGEGGGGDEYIVAALDSALGTSVNIAGESYDSPSGKGFTLLVALHPGTGEVEWTVTIWDPAADFFGHQLIGPSRSNFPGRGSLVMIGTAYNAIKIRWSDGSESTSNADSSSGTRDIFIVRTDSQGRQVNWNNDPSFFHVGSEGDDLFSTAVPTWTNGGHIAIGAMWERGTGDWACQHDSGALLSSGSYAGTYKEIIFQVNSQGRCTNAAAVATTVASPVTYLQGLIPTGDSQKIIAIGTIPTSTDYTFSDGAAPTGSSDGSYVIAEWFKLDDMSLQKRETFNPSEPGAQVNFKAAHLAGDGNEAPLVFGFEISTGAMLGTLQVKTTTTGSHPVFGYYNEEHGLVAYDVMSTKDGAYLRALVGNPELEREPYTLIHVDNFNVMADMDSRFRNSSYTRANVNVDYLGVLRLYGYEKDD